jgi:hypothetical protein
MTTQTSDVGPLLMPLPAGDVGDKIADTTVEALLDFLAWSLNTELSTKLGNVNGTSNVAVPTNNRYAWDPLEPVNKIKFNVPALFVWWDGKSTHSYYSILQAMRTREIQALYIFQELPGRDAMAHRSGLFNSVDAAFFRAADRESHPSYSYNSAPLGTELSNSVGDLGSWGWDYVGGQGVNRIKIGEQPRPLNNPIEGRQNRVGRDYPGFAAKFLIHELVQTTQPEDPENVTRDSVIQILNDGVEILDRTLTGTDGTDC